MFSGSLLAKGREGWLAAGCERVRFFWFVMGLRGPLKENRLMGRNVRERGEDDGSEMAGLR